MQILFLSRWFPFPPDNGARIRIFNLIKSLANYHQVDLISFAPGSVSEELLDSMQQYCRRVKVVEYRPFQPDRLSSIRGYFSSMPRSMVDTYSLEMQRLVETVGNEIAYDIVIASEVDMIPYAMLLPCRVKLLEELEISVLKEGFSREANWVKQARKKLTWWKLISYLNRTLPSFAGCTVVSEQERQNIFDVVPKFNQVEVIPNGVDTSYHQVDSMVPDQNSVIYTGALTYHANFDAMAYFVGEILPLIQEEIPEIKLKITGKYDGVPIDLFTENQAIELTGYVADIRPYVSSSWLSVVPLRIGGGTRLKILESLALGTPVVSTPKGAEGLDLIPGQDLIIANSARDFADAVIRLSNGKELRQKLSKNGRHAVTSKYDWCQIGEQLNRYVEEIVSRDGQRSLVYR